MTIYGDANGNRCVCVDVGRIKIYYSQKREKLGLKDIIAIIRF